MLLLLSGMDTLRSQNGIDIIIKTCQLSNFIDIVGRFEPGSCAFQLTPNVQLLIHSLRALLSAIILS